GIFPPKVEVFTWQLLKGRILVRNVLSRLGMNQMVSIDCPICSTEIETIDHIFLHCAWSSQLWATCMGWWGISFCTTLTVNDWVNGWNGLCPFLNMKRDWNLLFFAMVWTIWEFRNNVVFGGKDANSSMAQDSVRFRVAWWFKNFGCGSKEDITILLLDIKNRCVDKYQTKVNRFYKWSPPLGNDLVFNVEGSARGNQGMAGIGGVLRDARGKILCLFSSCIGIAESNTTEVFTIHRACKLISFKQPLAERHITIISDSKAAVAWINGEGFGLLSLVNKSLPGGVWKVLGQGLVSHVFSSVWSPGVLQGFVSLPLEAFL
ncbi:hypothetical protein Dsin_029186, partial [Dipteronia sinensis]